MVTVPAGRRRTHLIAAGQCGFTLIELLVATAVSLLVLGGAVALTSQVQNGYRRQVEDSAAVQEGRYALDWLGRLIRGAGSNPYDRLVTDCPVSGTPIEAITIDPNLNQLQDDIRLQADNNPPDGVFGGQAGACNQANEDVTISFDAASNTIVFLDNNLGGTATVRTDQVIGDLRFIYRDPDRNLTADEAAIAYVEVQITVGTRTPDPTTGAPVTRTLTQEFRVRGRPGI
jgi:prepilin-type N-terminal cleavage/methylation domain-containing protein